MSRTGEAFARVEAASRADLRAWLAAHHGQTESIWLVTYKKAAGTRYLPYAEIVEEAICFGWVDSVPRALDAMRSMRLLSPRKPRSAWSKVNKARAEMLIATGLMMTPGLAKIEQSKANGSWERLDEVEALSVPPDLLAKLVECAPAAKNFAVFPRSSKRLILEWLSGAKRPDTRSRRIAEIAQKAARNERANHFSSRSNKGNSNLGKS